MKHKHGLTGCGAALLALVMLASAGWAQVVPSTAIRVGAGYAEYDLSGTGNMGSAMVGFDYAVTPFLLLTASTDYFSYKPQLSENRSHFLVPEAGVQMALSASPVSPYVGVGAGWGFRVSGDGDNDPTLFAAIGSRFAVQPGIGAWVEGRVRSIDPWVGTTAEIKVGLSKSL